MKKGLRPDEEEEEAHADGGEGEDRTDAAAQAGRLDGRDARDDEKARKKH